MIGIIDYGVGNLFSLKSSFAAIGAETFVSGDVAVLAKADKLILPGVGAFGPRRDPAFCPTGDEPPRARMRRAAGPGGRSPQASRGSAAAQ